MRSLHLARIAAEAEQLRLRRMTRRTARRVFLVVFAVFFLLAALGVGHLAIWLALQPTLTPLQAMLAVGAGDLVIALVLIGLASRSSPDAVEREARRVRDEAGRAVLQDLALIRLFMTMWDIARRR